MKQWLVALFLTPAALFAETTPAAAPVQTPDAGLMQTLVMVVVALLFFYLILWRPEQKRRKALDTQRSAMKKGDQVVAMGIVGTVSKIKEHTVIVRSVETEIEFLKAAISEVRPEQQ